MITRWLSTIEACQVLDISQSTLRRRIDKGELESKTEDGRRLVLVATDNQVVTTESVERLVEEKAELEQAVKQLKLKLSETEAATISSNERINRLTEEKTEIELELREAEKKAALLNGLSDHRDQLQQQLTEKDKQIESLQTQLQETSHRHDTIVMQLTKIVEYQQQPFWRKLFQRKQLPPPVDETIVDAEPGTEEVKSQDGWNKGGSGHES